MKNIFRNSIILFLLAPGLLWGRSLSLYTAVVIKNKTGSAVNYKLVETIGPQSSLFLVGETEGRIYRKPRKLFDIGTQTILSEKNYNIVVLDVFNPLKENLKCRIGVVLEANDYQARVQSVVTDGHFCTATWQSRWFETDLIRKGVIGKPVQITIDRAEQTGLS